MGIVHIRNDRKQAESNLQRSKLKPEQANAAKDIVIPTQLDCEAVRSL